MISWLEDYLRSFRGTILMVTHDRYFLDRVTNRILEISHGKLYGYQTAYSGFLELKAEREEMELASERKRQSILRIELEWAKRWMPCENHQAESASGTSGRSEKWICSGIRPDGGTG